MFSDKQNKSRCSMSNTTTETVFKEDPEIWSLMEKILRDGARKMLQQALENEVAENEKTCILVVMGADETGKKELISVTDGYSESAISWKEILLQIKLQGLE